MSIPKEYTYIVNDNTYIKINKNFYLRYKIGKTINPSKRFQELKEEQCCGASNFEINYLIETDDMTYLETYLHRTYSHLRIDHKKEWFYLDIELFDIFINNYCLEYSNCRILNRTEINILNGIYKKI